MSIRTQARDLFRHAGTARLLTSLLAAGAVGATVCTAGCAGGHGEYTAKHKAASQEKMDQMRSGTEFDMARQAFLAGDLDKALKRADNSIALNDGVTKSHVLKGRILLEMGDLDGARESLLKAEALDPKGVDPQYYLGLSFERSSDKAQALERYLKAAEFDPTSPQYAVAAAEMMIDQGQLDQAESYLSGRGQSFQHFAGVRQTLGHIAMIRGDAKSAVALFGEARLLAPEDKGIVEDLARAQMAAGKFAEAEFNINHLLKTPQGKARRDLQHMEAMCLMEVDRPVEAREILVKLTTGDEGANDLQAWIDLGQVSHRIKDFNRVKQAGARLVALAPTRSEGYVLKALWQRSQGDLSGALTNLDKGCELRGRDVSPVVFRAMVLEEMGRDAEARAAIAVALAANPSDQVVKNLLEQMRAVGVANVPETPGN
jgi:Flp pilus assembly protein TadD